MIYTVNTNEKILDIISINLEEDEKNLITLKKFFKAQGYTIFEKYKIGIEVDPMYDTGINIKFIPSPGITVTGTGTTFTFSEDYASYTNITIPNSYSESNNITK